MRSRIGEALDWLARLDLGIWILGFATFGFGLACLLQRDFAIYWQPVPESTPFRPQLAFISAVLQMVSGLALLHRRTAHIAVWVVIGLYVTFAAVYFTTIFPWLGVAENLAVAVGAWTISMRLTSTPIPQSNVRAIVARTSFGVFSLVFGVMHFLALKQTIELIPEWMPGDPSLWAKLTGAGHLAAGFALITGRFAILATRLAGLMYLCFAAIVWTPAAIVHGVQWLRWAGDAITLAMMGGVWSLGDYLSRRAP